MACLGTDARCRHAEAKVKEPERVKGGDKAKVKQGRERGRVKNQKRKEHNNRRVVRGKRKKNGQQDICLSLLSSMIPAHTAEKLSGFLVTGLVFGSSQ